jgi:hypothetical protein
MMARTLRAGALLLAACAASPQPATQSATPPATEPAAETPPAPPPPLPPQPPPLPAEVDLRPQFIAFDLAPRAQGPRPTCSVFTVAAAFEFAFARLRGRGERLSVEYLNWAANAATGRRDDGDFFHCVLAGYERFGVCPDALLPYADRFLSEMVPPPDALVAGGRLRAEAGDRLRVRWLRPLGNGPGLDAAQFDLVRRTLARGWPVAAGSGHSRLLVGYRDGARAGGGAFLTLDSGLARFAEVDYEFVRTQINDAFAVEVAAAP